MNYVVYVRHDQKLLTLGVHTAVIFLYRKSVQTFALSIQLNVLEEAEPSYSGDTQTQR